MQTINKTVLISKIRSTRDLVIQSTLLSSIFLIFILGAEVLGDTTNVMIVFDASGSMGERLEGRTKMDIAKETIKDVVRTLPENVRLGMRVYGHQSPRYRHDCKDSRLEVPLDFVNYERFASVLKRITYRGYTPLAYSLSQVEKDFVHKGRNVVVCVTDGIETCGGDPCVVADTLFNSNIKVVFHVVGFNVGEADKEVLLCIPFNSGGHYFSADNVEELKKALEDVFRLSINPGYLKLGFKDLEESHEFIYGILYSEGKRYLFQNVTTHFFTSLPPGTYDILNFRLKSALVSNPYCPDKTKIESVKIRSGEKKVLPLDEYAILRVYFNYPEEKPEKTILSFCDHDPQHIIPDRDINSNVELVLLRPGKYDFDCTIEGENYLRTVSINNRSLLPQSYNEITFDLVIKEIPYWWILLGLIIPAFALIKFLSKVRGKHTISMLEEFAKYPQRFRGKKVTLELRMSENDKGCGKTVVFWTFFPVELTVHINVSKQFVKLNKFNTKNKIIVTFYCKAGELDKGNILISYKKGNRI